MARNLLIAAVGLRLHSISGFDPLLPLTISHRWSLIHWGHYRKRRNGIIEQFSTFELLAELGLGLAGFAGVAAAFGGRAREYGSTDLNRLMILFTCAGLVVAGSLTVMSLVAYGLEDATIYVVVSAVAALIFGAAAVPLWLAAYRNVRDQATTAPAWVVMVGTACVIAVEMLFVLNLFKGGEAGPLIAAFSLSLVYGLWVFIRLMTRPN